MRYDPETHHFMLLEFEAVQLRADRLAIPKEEAADLLTWVQYRQGLNEAFDPSIFPAGTARNAAVNEYRNRRRLFAEVITLVEPHLRESIADGATELLRSRAED